MTNVTLLGRRKVTKDAVILNIGESPIDDERVSTGEILQSLWALCEKAHTFTQDHEEITVRIVGNFRTTRGQTGADFVRSAMQLAMTDLPMAYVNQMVKLVYLGKFEQFLALNDASKKAISFDPADLAIFRQGEVSTEDQVGHFLYLSISNMMSRLMSEYREGSPFTIPHQYSFKQGMDWLITELQSFRDKYKKTFKKTRERNGIPLLMLNPFFVETLMYCHDIRDINSQVVSMTCKYSIYLLWTYAMTAMDYQADVTSCADSFYDTITQFSTLTPEQMVDLGTDTFHTLCDISSKLFRF